MAVESGLPNAVERSEGELAARVQLRQIINDEGGRLLRIVRRGTGSVVTWRRAQSVLRYAQGMSAALISEVVFTDPDTVGEVIHNSNRDGFDALYAVCGWAPGDVHAASTTQDQEDRIVGLD